MLTPSPTPTDAELLDDAAFAQLLADCVTELGGPVTAQRAARKAIEQCEYELTILHKSTYWDGRRDEDLWQRSVIAQEAARGRAIEEMQRAAELIAAIEARIADLRARRYAAQLAGVDEETGRSYIDAQRGRYIGSWVR